MTRTSLVATSFVALALAACADSGPTAPSSLRPSAGPSLDLASAPVTSTVCSDATTAAANSWFVIVPNARYGAPIAGSVWVGPAANSGLADYAVGTTSFSTSFVLPAAGYFTNATVTGGFFTDNNGTVRLNGTAIASNPSGDVAANYGFGGAAPTAFATAVTTGGSNTLSFDLVNVGGPAGLDFCYTVSYSTCPAAPAVAQAYLATKGYKANSSTAKYVIALVGGAMTQGAEFNGLAPCDAGYAAAVQSFVTSALGG
jgi:hypothetical protein